MWVFFRKAEIAQKSLSLEKKSSNFDMQLGPQSVQVSGTICLEKDTLGPMALLTAARSFWGSDSNRIAVRRRLKLGWGKWLHWPATPFLHPPCRPANPPQIPDSFPVLSYSHCLELGTSWYRAGVGEGREIDGATDGVDGYEQLTV